MSVVNLGPVDYLSLACPDGYRCTECDAHGVKLWREYNTFLSHQTYYCAECAKKRDPSNAAPVDENGLQDSKHDTKTDQVGGAVPAVPTVEGDTYWGYGAIPSAGAAWWRALPTHDPDEPREARYARMVKALAESADGWRDAFESANRRSGEEFHRTTALYCLTLAALDRIEVSAKLLTAASLRKDWVDTIRSRVTLVASSLEGNAASLREALYDPRKAHHNELADTRADAVQLAADADEMALAIDEVTTAIALGNELKSETLIGLANTEAARARAEQRRADPDYARPGAPLIESLKDVLHWLKTDTPEVWLVQLARDRVRSLLGRHSKGES